MSKEVDLLRRAFQDTERIITNVKPEQMSNATPCNEWNVRALLNHTVGAMHMIATTPSAGCISPGATTRPTSPVNTTSDMTRGFNNAT